MIKKLVMIGLAGLLLCSCVSGGKVTDYVSVETVDNTGTVTEKLTPTPAPPPKDDGIFSDISKPKVIIQVPDMKDALAKTYVKGVSEALDKLNPQVADLIKLLDSDEDPTTKLEEVKKICLGIDSLPIPDICADFAGEMKNTTAVIINFCDYNMAMRQNGSYEGEAVTSEDVLNAVSGLTNALKEAKQGE